MLDRLHVRVRGRATASDEGWAPHGQGIEVESFEKMWPEEKVQGFLGYLDLETLKGRQVLVFVDKETGGRYVEASSLELGSSGLVPASIAGSQRQVFVGAVVEPGKRYAGLGVLRIVRMAQDEKVDAATSASELPLEFPHVIDESHMSPGSELQGAFVVDRVELAYYYEPQTSHPSFSPDGNPPAPQPVEQILQPVWVFYGHNADNSVTFGGYPTAVMHGDDPQCVVIELTSGGLIAGRRSDTQMFWIPQQARSLWESEGGLDGRLGFPTSNVFLSGGELRLEFERGYLTAHLDESNPGAESWLPFDVESVGAQYVDDPGAELRTIGDLGGRVLRQAGGTTWFIDDDGARHPGNHNGFGGVHPGIGGVHLEVSRARRDVRERRIVPHVAPSHGGRHGGDAPLGGERLLGQQFAHVAPRLSDPGTDAAFEAGAHLTHDPDEDRCEGDGDEDLPGHGEGGHQVTTSRTTTRAANENPR